MIKAEIIRTTDPVYCKTTTILEKLGLILKVLKLFRIVTGFILEMIRAG